MVGLSYICTCHVLQIPNHKTQIPNKSQIPIPKLSKLQIKRAKFQGTLTNKKSNACSF